MRNQDFQYKRKKVCMFKIEEVKAVQYLIWRLVWTVDCLLLLKNKCPLPLLAGGTWVDHSLVWCAPPIARPWSLKCHCRLKGAGAPGQIASFNTEVGDTQNEPRLSRTWKWKSCQTWGAGQNDRGTSWKKLSLAKYLTTSASRRITTANSNTWNIQTSVSSWW